jgi:hypothetical protein
MSSRGRHVDAVGVRGRLLALSREVSAGVLGCPVALGVIAGWEGTVGVREGVARRREVSRGHTTGGDRHRWKGPNAKPSDRTFVLVGVALTAANPARGLEGRV